MAQNITLLGANYPDVPAVQLPITGGGTATFSDTRSVTYNLTGGASASVTPSEAVTGQGFSVKLKAPIGYSLSGVTITMGGVDITSQVFTPDASGGGRSAELGTKTITVNGTYDAEDDDLDGYSSVTVNVANSYSAGDEGKVVSNGALVAQGSDTVTANGTVDTTLINSLFVNVASPVKTATGTFTGNGTRQVTISSTFEPDLIYWTSDPGTTASSGTVAGIIAREMMAANRYRNNSTSNSHYAVIDITAMNTGGSSYSFRATYSNNTVTLYCFSNNARSLFTNDRTYTYKFVKWTT